MQLMQIIGDRHVRLIPDVMVGGNSGGNGLVDGLLSMILWNQTGHKIDGSTPDGSSEVTPQLDAVEPILPASNVVPAVKVENPLIDREMLPGTGRINKP